ncbi:MAG: hypothetical protein ABSG91_17630 [Syntrophobacteraceae bacterium]|jgi:dolichol kinase
MAQPPDFGTTAEVILPGEHAGDYSESWSKTFDVVFLAGWLIAFLALLAITLRIQPDLLTHTDFFLFLLIKLIIMVLMSLTGGMICRHYCSTDDKGYILKSKNSWFKVNYTRKLQHFAAYLVPLISGTPRANTGYHPIGFIPHVWEGMMTLLMFLVLIKPLRECSTFFMLQFNSLDRPEDRPHTLKWIVLGNIIPGLILIIVFKQLFEYIDEPDLGLIIVFIVGIGDGLAEPVGIHWGRKKYLAPSWGMNKRYIRTYVGSACVFITGVVSTLFLYQEFNSTTQFLVSILFIPAIMTLVEATAPHSMDTPAMMTIGFSVLYAICVLL